MILRQALQKLRNARIDADSEGRPVVRLDDEMADGGGCLEAARAARRRRQGGPEALLDDDE